MSCRVPRVLFLALLFSWAIPAFALDEAELRRRVDLLERSGNYPAAVPYYRQLLQLAPDDSATVHGLAHSLEMAGDFQAVVDLLEPWLQRRPADLAAGLRLGDAQAGRGDSQQALRTWRRILRQGTPTAAWYQQLGDHCQAAGLHAEAIRFLVEGRKELAQPELFSWELAQLYLRQEDYPRAVDAYLLALRQNPQRYALVETNLLERLADPRVGTAILQALQTAIARPDAPDRDRLQASRLASSCLLERGEPQPGLQYLAEIAVTPEIADLLFQYASRCAVRGYDEVAARAYALFAARRADSPYLYQALLRQAEIHTRRGDHARAAALYSQLVDRYPGQPETREALFHLGRLKLEELDDLEAARATFETLLQTPQRDSWTYRALEQLAECALRAGELPTAASYLDRLLGLDPGAAYPTRFRQAELRYFQADLNGARKLLEDLLAEDPAHELANDALDLLLRCAALQEQEPALEHFVRAHLLERRNLPDQAVEEWNWLARHASPSLGELSLLTQARSRSQQGDATAALALYDRLVEQYPRGTYRLDAQTGIARLHEQQGDLEAALKAYETTLLTDPDDARAPEIRLQIQRLRRQVETR